MAPVRWLLDTHPNGNGAAESRKREKLPTFPGFSSQSVSERTRLPLLIFRRHIQNRGPLTCSNVEANEKALAPSFKEIKDVTFQLQ